MKPIEILVITYCLLAQTVPAQIPTNKPLTSEQPEHPGSWATGEWITPAADGLLNITISGDELEVYLLRTRPPELRDQNNPHPTLQGRLLNNIELGSGFRFKGDHWQNGRLYDPKSGKRYKCAIRYVDADHIEVTGYIGIELFGESTIWERKAHFRSSIARMLGLDETLESGANDE